MPTKTPSILLGALVTTVLGLFMAVMSFSGGTAGQYLSSLICCLTGIAGAGVAVWHYANTHKLTLKAGAGAGLGALAVAVGGLISYVITEALQAVGLFPTDAEIMEQQRQQLLAQGMDPAQVDQGLQFAQTFQGPIGVVVNVIVLAILGAVFGAIAASVFKKGQTDYDEV